MYIHGNGLGFKHKTMFKIVVIIQQLYNCGILLIDSQKLEEVATAKHGAWDGFCSFISFKFTLYQCWLHVVDNCLFLIFHVEYYSYS